jgi:hypothetical protein
MPEIPFQDAVVVEIKDDVIFLLRGYITTLKIGDYVHRPLIGFERYPVIATCSLEFELLRRLECADGLSGQ